MTMLRTIGRLAAVLAIAATALSCGPKSQKPADVDADIQIWQGFNREEQEIFEKIMADFEKDWEARTGKRLRIRADYVDFNSMFTKLKTAALARQTPDIAFIDTIKVTDLGFGNALTPIDKLPNFKYDSIEKAREEFVTASFDAGVLNRLGERHLYAIPVQTTTVALFWNRGMFRQKAAELRAAGLDPNRPPQTWTEMEAYGKVLSDKENGVYAYAMHGSLWFQFTMFNMYNVEFIRYDEKGRAQVAVDNPKARAAFERLKWLADSGVEGGGWRRGGLGPDVGFTNGKYAMIMTGPWNVQNFTNQGLDFDIALMPAPPPEEVERLGLESAAPEMVDELGPLAYSGGNLGGQSGIIMRMSEEPDVAYEFLEYFTSEKVQREWASTLGQIPVRTAAWKDLDTTKYPFLPRFMDQLRFSRRVPPIPLYGTLESDIVNPLMDSYLLGQTDTDQLVKALEKELDSRILSRINEAIE